MLAVRKDCPPFAASSPVHRTARFPPSISSRPYRLNPREQNSSFPLKSDAEVTELLPACRPSRRSRTAWESIRPSHLAVDGLNEGFDVSVSECERLETARIVLVTGQVVRADRA